MKHSLLLSLIALPLLFSTAAQATESKISLSLGYYDFLDNEEALDVRAEYRSGHNVLWGVSPFVGVEATSDGALYALGGVYYDWKVSENIFITPSFGAGLYSDGDGKDLGYSLEFRSQLEAGYEFESGRRLSAGFSHISNGGFGDHNPGTEVLSFYYHIPW